MENLACLYDRVLRLAGLTRIKPAVAEPAFPAEHVESSDSLCTTAPLIQIASALKHKSLDEPSLVSTPNTAEYGRMRIERKKLAVHAHEQAFYEMVSEPLFSTVILPDDGCPQSSTNIK